MLSIRTSLIIGIALKLRQNWRKEVEPLPAPLRYAGFTLIELSIVLVIIGLIVGGVLVGQDLIQAARERAQISQIEKYKIASNTFTLKYGQLAGDITPPANFGLTDCTASGGNWCTHIHNGNRRINSYFRDIDIGYYGMHSEGAYFFLHLQEAGLTDDKITPYQFNSGSGPNVYYNLCGDQANLPPAAIGKGGVSILYTRHRGRMEFHIGYDCQQIAPVQSPKTNGILDPQIMRRIDQKIDDGLPLAGEIVAANDNGLHTSSSPSCVSSGLYINEGTVHNCVLAIPY